MVVNFPVEDNRGVAIIRNDRLITTLEVDNLQSRRAHRKYARAKHAALIGPAMSKRSRGAFDALRFRRPILMCKAGYTAQIRTFRPQAESAAVQPLFPHRLVSPNSAPAGYIAYPKATSATPAQTSTTPVQRAKLTSSPKIYFAPNVPTT